MKPSDTPSRPLSAQAPAAPAAPATDFLLCEECGAPVDRDQRYCVSCGARQTHAPNPAVEYFTSVARAHRTPDSSRTPARALGAPALALFFLLLPLAAGIGVLAGRSGSGQDALIAALRSQKPIVVTASGPSGPSGVATAATPATAIAGLPSSGSLHAGFAIELSTLPEQSTDQAAAATAEAAARAKGAAPVGLLNPAAFRTSPDQGSSDYVIYAGPFASKAAASAALAKLKSRFPGALVIAVTPAQAASTAPTAASAAPATRKTAYGTVQQIAGSKVSAQQRQEGARAVTNINKTVGQSYVNATQNLPDTVVVPASPGAGQP